MSRSPDHCPACGYVLRQRRHSRAHRLFFSMINIAFENWPEKHYAEFRPNDREHLRAWLLWQAGHYDTVADRLQHDVGDEMRVKGFMTAVLLRMHANGTHFFFLDAAADRLVAYVPRSIGYEYLDERAFAPIRQAVFDEIEIRLETKIALLIEEAKRASKLHKLRGVAPLPPRRSS